MAVTLGALVSGCVATWLSPGSRLSDAWAGIVAALLTLPVIFALTAYLVGLSMTSIGADFRKRADVLRLQRDA